ncbi:NAD(P)-binding protein [Streptomyces sp. NPDC059544]|uniref:NAD(P)-binding protein n=1 Tax=Streptomyces sp. NPDC059544 TaxID=3346861 RepID=UPI0036AB7523
MEHADVAVIGGGQSGVAAACALRERGLKPVVPEASEKPGLLAALQPRLLSPARYGSPVPTGGRCLNHWTGARPARLTRARPASEAATCTTELGTWTSGSLWAFGSTYVNIDVCRMRRCCRCSSPPTRAWRRAARR